MRLIRDSCSRRMGSGPGGTGDDERSLLSIKSPGYFFNDSRNGLWNSLKLAVASRNERERK